MIKTKILTGLFLIASTIGNCQVKKNISSDTLAADLKKLIELNSHIPSLVDLSGKEAVNISDNATAEQVIAITTPYLNDELTLNAKSVCLGLLAEAMTKKSENQKQKEAIVEILCRNYLSENQIYKINFLLTLRERDFNTNAKKYIAALIDSPRVLYNTTSYKLLGLAQIKKSIPVLWKIANESEMGQSKDIWASLARMNENKAAHLLCSYYDSLKNVKGYEGTLIAKQLAFAMHKTVLDCLVKNYIKMDLKYVYRDGDSGYTPSQVLGGAITTMLKDYPYKKGEYNIDPQQLLDWLEKNKNYALAEK